jgi:hypothetical protein
VLRTVDPSNYANTSTIADPDLMSNNVAFGLRPECAWPGTLFQVFLQGSFAADWYQRKDLEYWIAFEGHNVKAGMHEIESLLGTGRHVLQCLVPEINKVVGRVPVTLTLHDLGGKPLTQPMFLGFFQYKPNGISFLNYRLMIDATLNKYDSSGSTNLLDSPQDIDPLSPYDRGEILEPASYTQDEKYMLNEYTQSPELSQSMT